MVAETPFRVDLGQRRAEIFSEVGAFGILTETRTAGTGERGGERRVQPAPSASGFPREGENRSYTEGFMYRFGERLIMCCAPLLLVLGGCSSESLPAGAGGAGGAGAVLDAAAGVQDATPAGTTMVTIPMGATGRGLGGYSPNPAVVAVGSTVMWMNADSIAHTATSSTGVWDSGPIAPGGSFSRVFNERGTFPYFCTIHGAASMSGTVVVQ
jgi:plastocyanin